MLTKNKLLSKLLCVAGISAIVLGGYGLSTVHAGTTSVDVNSTTFPDDNFRSYILGNFDVNFDQKLSSSELQNVREIDCSYLELQWRRSQH